MKSRELGTLRIFNCLEHPQKTDKHMPCADKTVIWENYKIGICQAGLDNKTGGTQLRLGVACFCAFKGWKSLIFCSVMHCSKTGISDFIYSFDLVWKRENCYYSANRLHELKKHNRVKDFRSVAKFFSKTTTTMFWLPKQVRTFFLTYYLSIFLELIVTYS